MQLEPPRAPTPHETALLTAYLDNEFEGVEELRQQAQCVLVARSCMCGCGTIDLMPQGADLPLSRSGSPVPCDGLITDSAGEPIGGLILFLEDGLLAVLEVYSYGDGPFGLPHADEVMWDPR